MQPYIHSFNRHLSGVICPSPGIFDRDIDMSEESSVQPLKTIRRKQKWFFPTRRREMKQTTQELLLPANSLSWYLLLWWLLHMLLHSFMLLRNCYSTWQAFVRPSASHHIFLVRTSVIQDWVQAHFIHEVPAERHYSSPTDHFIVVVIWSASWDYSVCLWLAQFTYFHLYKYKCQTEIQIPFSSPLFSAAILHSEWWRVDVLGWTSSIWI